MTQGRSIRLFLVDGSPNGLLTAEIMNWNGHCLTGPRTKLTELVQRPECGRTGSYNGAKWPLAIDDSVTIINSNNTPHASQRCAPWGVTFFGRR